MGDEYRRAGVDVFCDDQQPVSDSALFDLLTRAYVQGGFTEADVALRAFEPAAVRARGSIFYVPNTDGSIAAIVVAVSAASPARRLAKPGEAELHLLATSPHQRRRGLGRAVVAAALSKLRRDGCTRVLLWTQPTMHAAHRLYGSVGFERVPSLDFARAGRGFLVYDLRL
jgi:ribosomal protein S18 acetylase RimI-like enzyme